MLVLVSKIKYIQHVKTVVLFLLPENTKCINFIDKDEIGRHVRVDAVF